MMSYQEELLTNRKRKHKDDLKRRWQALAEEWEDEKVQYIKAAGIAQLLTRDMNIAYNL